MIGHLDCSTGVSGDKFLGAVLDAGERLAALEQPGFTVRNLRQVLAAIAPEAELIVERGTSRGVAATRVRLDGPAEPHSRSWGDLSARIREADLADSVRERSLAVFERLAAAEALVHGVEPQNVHFHEVGGLDSVLDIVGTVAGLDALGVETLVVTPIATGGGTVQTEHGVLPVPAPATAELLVGAPIVAGPEGPDGAPLGELTTPTGAALATTFATRYGTAPAMLPVAIGYGAGTRDIGMPNVTRLILGIPSPVSPVLEPERVVLLETNIDHLAPEQVGYIVDQLLAEGALDVWLTPIVMKKSRSAVLLSLLTLEMFASDTAARIVGLTGSLGVRRTDLEREISYREVLEVDTPWGLATVKIGAGRVRAEHDDVVRIASENHLPYGFVREEIARLAIERIG